MKRIRKVFQFRCAYCGAESEKRPHERRPDGHNFCSIQCYQRFNSKHMEIETVYDDPGAIDSALNEYRALAEKMRASCERLAFKRFVDLVA